jgi:aspartate aminotransferase
MKGFAGHIPPGLLARLQNDPLVESVTPDLEVTAFGVGPQEHVKEMVVTYNMRRKFMIKRLKEIGFGINYEPEGAYYVLANAKEFSTDSLDLSRNILEEAGVAVTPGIDFGDGAKGYIRFSYANSIGNIREGMDRIEKYLRK